MPKIAVSTSRGKLLAQREQAHRELRRLLLLQKISPGRRLGEPAWAKRLGVNRTALREAFARLEAEGLIEKGPQTGYFVPVLSEGDIREILQTRLVVEVAAMEILLASRKNTPQHLKPLRHACDDLERFLERGYSLGFSEADRRFHESLVEVAGNQRLRMIYQRAPLPMIHDEVVRSEHWLNEGYATLRDHREILSHLVGGDIEAAKTILREHLTYRGRPAIMA
ncbi:MAG: GntR family transcriptional regulator [Phycisphaerales bacterium]|nr:GntR family transcriptional regulator [Phycisphaerales bacterium]